MVIQAIKNLYHKYFNIVSQIGGSAASSAGVTIPIGSIIPWLGNLTNTPALNAAYKECDGTSISDAESVYNGQTIPNLNSGTHKLLRGNSAASGGTAGAASFGWSHTHSLVAGTAPLSGITTSSGTAGGTVNLDPPYHTVRYIMKIKAGEFPIGGLKAFMASYTNTPTLPANFAYCDGQTISDAASVYDGVALPNLNQVSAAQKVLLKGSTTSGSTGGTETFNIAHTHSFNTSPSGSAHPRGGSVFGSVDGGTMTLMPPYYTTRWAVKIK